MKNFTNLLLLVGMFFTTINSIYSQFDGYALYNERNGNSTFLVDADGDIAHSWSLATRGNYAVLLMESGNIMRGAVNQANQINGAAVGGLVEEIDPQGNVVWSFSYSNSDHVSHHDITLMPDGNVLLTAWEVRNSAELQALGYNGNTTKYPTHFIEVSQDGTGGEIVWEWHILDHLIQDIDATKPNFGVVAEHPELMDINVAINGAGGGPGGGDGDWFHVNGVNYNSTLDLIAFSSRFLSEVFIIDHSTTTQEAASHTGGNSGKGGDFLYRWGNPSNYGAPGTQTILGPVHDVRWITNDGRPRAGFLQFFNNDGTGSISTVDALELPYTTDSTNFEFTLGQAYGPTTATWRHECLDNAIGQSASNTMPNGNTFVNLSREYMYEVDENNNLVWQHNGGGPPKAFRYTCDDPGIQALIAQGILDGQQCMLINATNELAEEQLSILPNPSSGIFNIEGLTYDYEIEQIQVFDLLGKKIQDLANTTQVNLSKEAEGIYIISMRLNNNQLISKKVSVVK